MIGRNRVRKLIMSIGSDERLKSKAKWENLVDFLNIELKGCEACFLNGKIRQSWSLENLGKSSETEKKYRNSKAGFLGDHKPSQKRYVLYL